MFFLLLFLLIWKDKSFAYIPLKKRDQNHVVHLKNFFGELDWFYKFEKRFLEGMKDLKV